jgi:DNA-binding transcriptional ArsR family regulator
MKASQKPQHSHIRLPCDRDPRTQPGHAAARSADRDMLATVETAYPGWRAWRTSSGALAARKGGIAPPGPHARGDSLAELMRAIEDAIHVCRPPQLPPAERAALVALEAAPEPLRVRAISDATGLPMSSTARALTGLTERGLVTRQRCGRRTWVYVRRPEPAHSGVTSSTSPPPQAAR